MYLGQGNRCDCKFLLYRLRVGPLTRMFTFPVCVFSLATNDLISTAIATSKFTARKLINSAKVRMLQKFEETAVMDNTID